jgi:hypothetical protein
MPTLIKSICQNCTSSFSQKKCKEERLKKFCNRSCAASYNNKQREYKNTTSFKSNCKNCKVEFVYSCHASTGTYCSNKCQREFQFLNKTLLRAEQGLINQPSTLKRVIEFKTEYKCFCCSITEWNGKRLSLHLDHIDGNSDNNFLENLRLLCPNCHSQTETFCGRNIKNTKRSSYNKRYRINKLALPLS